ncbi:unnamed protein product [Lactuca virosa]|uniref:phosphoribosylaminoimidazole carboxylase n=1 Tax=Lactuca virosa TaxID=75947 RepID=A0AAU9P192_9ASTR|nr:unnamed protein product [Lactuca virosa]
MYLMLSPSSFLHNTPTHQVGVTSALHYKLQKRNFNNTSFSSCSSSSSCSIINQQVNHTITCRASMETDFSQRKENASAHGVSETVVGVLGGGQLGRMLCQAASQMSIKINILDPILIMKVATDIASKAVASLEGAGVYAVELFLTEDDQILLNEVASRPHNSGHHTIESCYTSQYEQHLRAVVGLPLGDPSMKVPAGIMYNILGEDEGEGGFILAHEVIRRALCTPGASVHWYDKPEMRKQRKMGHITVVGPSMGIVEKRLKSFVNEDNADDTPVAPRVGIIMGSDSDLPVMKEAAKVLNDFDVSAEVRIVSAHRTAELMFSYASSAGERGIQVIIAGAGGAAHLPGMVAALTPLPVRASALDGLDSLLSIVQMPRGVPVATVAINNATNAALLALRILGLSDTALQARMAQFQQDARDAVLEKTQKLEKLGWEDYVKS